MLAESLFSPVILKTLLEAYAIDSFQHDTLKNIEIPIRLLYRHFGISVSNCMDLSMQGETIEFLTYIRTFGLYFVPEFIICLMIVSC